MSGIDRIELEDDGKPGDVQRGVIVAVASYAAVALCSAIVVDHFVTKAEIERFEAVCGRETFDAQRAEHLKRLRDQSPATDPVVRDRERADLDARIGELPKGERVDELGAEMRVERKERR